MSEKPETEEFDEDLDEISLEADDVDLERVTKDLDQARQRGSNAGIPAWRQLELLMEQKRTAELTSDFEDYDLDEPVRRSASRNGSR